MQILPLIIVAAIAYLVLRESDSLRRARVLQLAEFWLMATFAMLGALFIAGEALTEPGGIAGALLVASWAVLLAAVASIAWRRPDRAVPLLEAAVALAVALNLWFALQPDAWASFEDRNGPIRSIVAFAIAAGITPLGLTRIRAAGTLLLVVGITPFAIAGMQSRPLAVVNSPIVLSGLLYLAGAWTRDHARPRLTA